MVPTQTNQHHDSVFPHNQLSNRSSIGNGARNNRVPLSAVCAESLDLSNRNFNRLPQPPPCLGATTCSWSGTRCVQAQVDAGSVPTCESVSCGSQIHGRRRRKLPGLDSCDLAEPLPPIHESDGSRGSSNLLNMCASDDYIHRFQNTVPTISDRAQGQISSSSFLRAVSSPRPRPQSSSIVQRPLPVLPCQSSFRGVRVRFGGWGDQSIKRVCCAL